jgi:thiosulfate dehydrogenase [quinone] large subunit
MLSLSFICGKSKENAVMATSQSTERNTNFWLGTAVAGLAGLWTAVHIVLGMVSPTASGSDFWGYALLILFVLALVLAFVQYGQERSTLAAVSTNERFPEPPISRFFLGSDGSSILWFVVRMYVGAEWFLAGWEKVISPAWGVSGIGISGFVKGALAKTAGANPAVQGWYAWFLHNMVLPSAGFFSILITLGELAVGLGLLFGVLTGIAAGFGVLMNMNYLLAGTVSTNPILGMFGLFLVISWRVCGWIGADRWLLPLVGMPWKPGEWFHIPTSTPTPTPTPGGITS